MLKVICIDNTSKNVYSDEKKIHTYNLTIGEVYEAYPADNDYLYHIKYSTGTILYPTCLFKPLREYNLERLDI